MPPVKTSWLAAGAVVLVLSLWMLSGLSKDEQQSSTNADESQAPAITVQVETARPTLMARELQLHGQMAPIRQVTIKAQIQGQVQQLLVRKGAVVEENAPLIKLDEGNRRNALAEAQAAVKTARSEQAAAQSLQRQRLQSTLQLEQAEAALEAALARLAGIALDIEHTTVRAPFAGRVNELPVEVGALLDRGTVVAELIDDSAFQANVRVSQQSLSQLELGQTVTLSLITGETLSGVLSYIGGAADPQTRSFAVEALVQNPTQTIAAGVSATLSVPVEEVEATFITPSVLSLGDGGALGVKAVDDNDRVLFLPIELVSSTIDGAWVSGIPDNTRIITLGQGFVGNGEKVSVQDRGEADVPLD